MTKRFYLTKQNWVTLYLVTTSKQTKPGSIANSQISLYSLFDLKLTVMSKSSCSCCACLLVHFFCVHARSAEGLCASFDWGSSKMTEVNKNNLLGEILDNFCSKIQENKNWVGSLQFWSTLSQTMCFTLITRLWDALPFSCYHGIG